MTCCSSFQSRHTHPTQLPPEVVVGAERTGASLLLSLAGRVTRDKRSTDLGRVLLCRLLLIFRLSQVCAALFSAQSPISSALTPWLVAATSALLVVRDMILKKRSLWQPNPWNGWQLQSLRHRNTHFHWRSPSCYCVDIDPQSHTVYQSLDRGTESCVRNLVHLLRGELSFVVLCVCHVLFSRVEYNFWSLSKRQLKPGVKNMSKHLAMRVGDVASDVLNLKFAYSPSPAPSDACVSPTAWTSDPSHARTSAERSPFPLPPWGLPRCLPMAVGDGADEARAAEASGRALATPRRRGVRSRPAVT